MSLSFVFFFCAAWGYAAAETPVEIEQERQHGPGDQGEPPLQEDHQTEVGEDHHRAIDQDLGQLHQYDLDVVDIGRQPVDQVSRTRGPVEGQGQPLQVREDVLADVGGDLLAHGEHADPVQVGDSAGEDADGDERQNQGQQQPVRIVAGPLADEGGLRGQRSSPDHVVEDQLQRPGHQERGPHGQQHADVGHRQQGPVRPVVPREDAIQPEQRPVVESLRLAFHQCVSTGITSPPGGGRKRRTAAPAHRPAPDRPTACAARDSLRIRSAGSRGYRVP